MAEYGSRADVLRAVKTLDGVPILFHGGRGGPARARTIGGKRTGTGA